MYTELPCGDEAETPVYSKSTRQSRFVVEKVTPARELLMQTSKEVKLECYRERLNGGEPERKLVFM